MGWFKPIKESYIGLWLASVVGVLTAPVAFSVTYLMAINEVSVSGPDAFVADDSGTAWEAMQKCNHDYSSYTNQTLQDYDDWLGELNKQAATDETMTALFWYIGITFGLTGVIVASRYFYQWRNNKKGFQSMGEGSLVGLGDRKVWDDAPSWREDPRFIWNMMKKSAKHYAKNIPIPASVGCYVLGFFVVSPIKSKNWEGLLKVPYPTDTDATLTEVIANCNFLLQNACSRLSEGEQDDLRQYFRWGMMNSIFWTVVVMAAGTAAVVFFTGGVAWAVQSCVPKHKKEKETGLVNQETSEKQRFSLVGKK